MTPQEARKILEEEGADGVAPAPEVAAPENTDMTPEEAQKIIDERAGSAAVSWRDYLSAAGRGANTGLVEAAPVLAGTLAGGAVGSLGGPLGMGAGAVVGGIAGSPAGSYIKEKLKKIPGAEMFLSEAAEESEELRPAYYAGKVVGGSLPFAAAPFGAARAGFESANPYISSVVRGAAEAPAKFAAGEASGITGSAVGSMVAQEIWPDQPWPRLAGEVIGGFVHPSSLAGRVAAPAIRDAAVSARSIVSEGGKMDRAALAVKTALDQAGEDVGALVKLLREDTLAGRETTSAAKTGSPTLHSMERQLAKLSEKFGEEQAERVRDNLEALRLLAQRLEETGNPEAMREAAKLRQRRFEAALETSMSLRKQDAAISAAQISKDSPAAAGEISGAAFKALRDSLSDARAAERELWGKVPTDIQVSPKNFADTYEEIRARMMPEQRLPRIVEDFKSRIDFFSGRGSKKKIPEGTLPITTGDLKSLRSDLLGMSRDAAAYGDWQSARRYNDLAGAILKDFDSVGEVAVPLTEARAFSNALHDVFTRTFAGRALERADTGAYKIAPELTIERALSGSGTAADLKSAQLRQATRFMSPASVPAREMEAAQDRAIRLAAKEVIDPTSGRVNPARVARFLQENEAILEDFPQIQRDLATAQGREKLFARVEKAHAEGRKIADRDAAFGKILRTDDPALSVGRALSGPAPVASMESFAKLAKAGGQDALRGFSTAVLQNARTSATTASGDFSFGRYWHSLTAPIRPGGPSQIDVLKKSGAMTSDQLERFTKIMSEAQRVEHVLKGARPIDDLIPETDQIYDFALRILGANVESIAPMSGSVGAPLVVAGAGSKLARNLFDRVPKGRVQDLLIEASKEPKFMAMLLERPITPRQKGELNRRMEAFLWNAGLISFPQAASSEETNAR